MSLGIFPVLPGIGWNISKTQVWSTRELTAASGKEYRAQNWSYPRYKFSIPIQFLRTFGSYQEFQTLIGFIGQQAGMFNNWLYSDPFDHTSTNQSLGVGNGSTTSFSLIRAIGGFVEPILAVNTISNVAVAGTSTSAYTLSSTYGYANDTIVFNSAPANGAAVTVTFTFYFVCRFTSDAIDFVNFMNNRWSVKSLDFESVK